MNSGVRACLVMDGRPGHRVWHSCGKRRTYRKGEPTGKCILEALQELFAFSVVREIGNSFGASMHHPWVLVVLLLDSSGDIVGDHDCTRNKAMAHQVGPPLNGHCSARHGPLWLADWLSASWTFLGMCKSCFDAAAMKRMSTVNQTNYCSCSFIHSFETDGTIGIRS